MAKAGGKHPGFKAVEESIAQKGGYSTERAGAILAARTREASPAAKRANPRLKNVKGKMSHHSPPEHHGAIGVSPKTGWDKG